MIQELQPPDTHHLSAARGWLELGNWREANEELEKITPMLRAHPDVLEIRHSVYSAARKCNEALEIARAVAKLAPDRAFCSVRAPDELGRTVEARDTLLAVR